MISAGRVLLMPKGAYDPSTTYEMLDIVSYNGSSYIAKGTTTGNLPTDTTYWQLSAYGGQAANMAGNFAELETSSVASAIHYENDIFVDENSQLMKATQTINIGDTIDENVNCTPTTVEALISYLSSYVDSLDSLNKKIQGAIEIAVQTDLHSLAIGEYYKKQTTFYVTNAPTGINQEASATFRLTVEAALDNASQASSPLFLTLRTPDGKVYTQGFDGTTWGYWEQSAAKSAVDTLSSEIGALTNKLNNEIATRSAMGAKNIFSPSMVSGGGNYIVSVSADGSIIHLTNPTANSWRNTRFLISVTPNTNYRVTAEAVYTSGHCSLDIRTLEDVTIAAKEIEANTSVDYTFNSGENTSVLLVAVLTRSISEIGDITFNNTMIRLASDPDDTYQPYAKTNLQLTKDSVTWDDLSEVGAVNRLKNNATTTTTTDGTTTFTWTVNDDKSVTVSAPSYPVTVASNQILIPWDNISADECSNLVGKVFKLSGCPSGGSRDTYRLQIYRVLSADGSAGTAEDYGEGNVFTWENNGSGTKAKVQIVIASGYTMTGPLTFKPMLTDPSYKGPYVPYAKTNKELTDFVDLSYSLDDETQISVADSSVLEITSCRLARKGNVLCGFVMIRCKTALPYNTPLFTLPTGFRPSAFCNIIGVENTTNATEMNMFGLWDNGAVQLQCGTVSASKYYRLQIIGII